MTIKAVIWDLDGTLADSAALHYQAWQAIMDRYGIFYTYQMFIDEFGRNNAEILTKHFDAADPATIQRVSLEKEADFRALLTPGVLQPLPGVMAWLAHFRHQGIVQVVGSSGPMANIAAMVRALDIGDYFLALVTGTHLPKGKPDPAIFLRCAAVAGVDPVHCLVIEDSIHGIEAAQRAGMRSVAVGALAGSAALRALCANPAAPPCLALASLDQITTPSSLFE
ncbi:MAG TPA: HAD family phosphatase [Chloroflexi bacterium]|nr:HAD family phosphatase [Chloroflexota bacterium]